MRKNLRENFRMNNPYLLIPILLAVLTLYLAGQLLVKFDVISVKQHRKVWNTLLLITFLVTAVLGLILVLQINYKFYWPWTKALLDWHVNFGIAMSIVATIHFIWHFNYYIKLFKRDEVKVGVDDANYDSSKNIYLTLIVLSGFLSTSIQVLLIREISTVFHGNELQMAWVMSIWMFLTGCGALAGSRTQKLRLKPAAFESILTILCMVPILLIVALNIAKNTIFSPGVLVSPLYFLIIVIVILSPICLLSGMAFSFLLRLSSADDRNYIKVYAFEAIGGIGGGIIVAIILIQWFSVLQSLLLIAVPVLLVLWLSGRSRMMGVYLVLSMALFLATIIFPIDKLLKSQLFINQNVILTRESYNGNITITENAGQYSIYENGSMTITTENLVNSEEFVHYAMLQHPLPKKVLLISGGFSGMLEEILKYPSVVEIDYVEPNPALVEIVSAIKTLPTDRRINTILGDGRRFLLKTDKKYDVAILAIPDPTSLLVNRYYTNEFVNLLKQKLNKNAVAIYGHTTTVYYITNERIGTEAAIYNVLRSNFNNVEVIVGEKDYFVASDSIVTNQVATLWNLRKIETRYVNAYYLNDEIIHQRGIYLKQNIDHKEIVNSDSKPLPVFFHSLQFLSLFSKLSWYLLVIPIVMLIIPAFFMNPVSTGIYATGFTASSVQILIMFAFQTFVGYLYTAIGLIIALFMAGLALGAFTCKRFSAIKNNYIGNQLILLLIAGLFPILWYVLRATENGSIQVIMILGTTLILAVFTGFQYVIGTERRLENRTKSASLIYSADLMGSALGALAITAILLPLIGLTYSCLIIAGMNLFAIVLNLWKKG